MRPLRCYLRNEARTFSSIWLLLRRRQDGVQADAVAVPYAGSDKSTLIVIAAVSAVETAVLWLADFGLVLDLLLLVLGIYSALLVFGVYAATVTRPHVVSREEVRVRYGAFYDVRLPMEAIASFRWRRESHEPGRTKTFQDQQLLLHGSSYETDLVVELREPVTVVRPLGKPELVRLVRFPAEDPAVAVRAYEEFSAAQR